MEDLRCTGGTCTSWAKCAYVTGAGICTPAARAKISVLETALQWLAERLERPGGTTAGEWMERAIEHGRKEKKPW
jgi:uncharacterized membrane-anchored protein